MDTNEFIRGNNQPLYKQVRDFILKNINDHNFKPGEVIPTERELCDMLSVSRHTIRKAIQELVHEGYLYRVQGAGTFVFDKADINNNNNNSYVGVILGDCSSELEFKILNGIEYKLKEAGYTITFRSSFDNYKKESENIQKMKNEGVAGMIIMPAEDQKDSTAISDLKEEEFPFVLVDRKLQNCETDAVLSDNIDGTYKATEHLINLGHKKIAFVKSKFSRTSSIEQRITGYNKALQEYGMSADKELTFAYNEQVLDDQIIYDKLYKFIQEKGVTAIVAVNDYVALTIVKMCRREGISIPDELSLVGFDNRNITEHLEVPLTTVAQFPEKMGFNAAKLLIDNIENLKEEEEGRLIRQVYCPVELVTRDSAAKFDKDEE